ncbi:MAG: hypothetical protein ABI572_00025 [Actinomycetota bacterium]
MGPVEAPRDELAALVDERGYLRLPVRAIRVTGADAAEWLHDLVTADISSLEPGRSRRSLLLTPTGKIRADLTVVRETDGFWLLQETSQPDRIEAMLVPYVLSSDVALHDASGEVAVFSIPARARASGGRPVFAPAALGPGVGVLVASGDPAEAMANELRTAGLVEAGLDALESWRILMGVPRMGADFDTGSLPAEAGLGSAIDRTKGCFLGQESVARVANLGHPPRILVRVAAVGDVGPGDPVSAEGVEVGDVTSAARDLTGRVQAFARVRWEARDARIVASGAIELETLPRSD